MKTVVTVSLTEPDSPWLVSVMDDEDWEELKSSAGAIEEAAQEGGYADVHDLEQAIQGALFEDREPFDALIDEPLPYEEAVARERWAQDVARGQLARGLAVLQHLHLPVPEQFQPKKTPLIDRYRIAPEDRAALLDELRP